jgi:hypothetical protein
MIRSNLTTSILLK